MVHRPLSGGATERFCTKKCLEGREAPKLLIMIYFPSNLKPVDVEAAHASRVLP